MNSYFLAPPLVTLRATLNRLFTRRDKTTDGWVGDAAHNARKSDHNPDWDDDGIVRAIDVDKDLPDSENAAQRIVDAITRDPRVAYVIFRRRIWQNPAVYSRGGWRPYTPSGKAGWYNPHEQHFHVSVRHGKRWDRDGSPWNLGIEEGDDELNADDKKWINARFDDLATGVEQALARHDAGLIRRLTLAAGLENGFVKFAEDGAYYAVEYDGSATPIRSETWAGFRKTARGSKTVVTLVPQDRYPTNKPESAV